MLTDPPTPAPPDGPEATHEPHPPEDVAAFAADAARTFLQPPHGITAVLADAVRVIGLATFLFSVFAWTGTTSAMFALALLGLVAPRFLGARPAMDLAIGITTLVSAASNRLDLYETLPWWDIPAHLVTTAALAALVILLADRAGVVVDRRPLPLGILSSRWASRSRRCGSSASGRGRRGSTRRSSPGTATRSATWRSAGWARS